MGDLTFLEAYEKTGRVINITVSPSANEEFPRLVRALHDSCRMHYVAPSCPFFLYSSVVFRSLLLLAVLLAFPALC